jgi:pimeloyl-ACP methyl ester carboxylesterase
MGEPGNGRIAASTGVCGRPSQATARCSMTWPALEARSCCPCTRASAAPIRAEWLRGAGFRIISPSRPGYLGTPLDSDRSLEQQADLLAALVDALSIRRGGVLAVSAGSPVGYVFAARHPDRVWRLVSIIVGLLASEGIEVPATGAVGSLTDVVQQCYRAGSARARSARRSASTR